eukprot:scaffold30132_cov72-Cyclotella_meneghiniana.AAC.8
MIIVVVLSTGSSVWPTKLADSDCIHLPLLPPLPYLASNPQIWAEQQIGLACVTHLGQHILRSHGQMTYSPHDDDDDVTSLDGSVASQDTLPYNFDMCQLIDMRKKNWRDIIATQLEPSSSASSPHPPPTPFFHPPHNAEGGEGDSSNKNKPWNPTVFTSYYY